MKYIWCCFYMFKVYMFDLEWNAPGLCEFTRYFLEVYWTYVINLDESLFPSGGRLIGVLVGLEQILKIIKHFFLKLDGLIVNNDESHKEGCGGCILELAIRIRLIIQELINVRMMIRDRLNDIQ